MSTELKRLTKKDYSVKSNSYLSPNYHEQASHSSDEDVITQHIAPIKNMLNSYRRALDQIKQQQKVFMARRTHIAKQSNKISHLKSGNRQVDQQIVHCRPKSGLSKQMNESDFSIDKLDQQIFELTKKINQMLK